MRKDKHDWKKKQLDEEKQLKSHFSTSSDDANDVLKNRKSFDEVYEKKEFQRKEMNVPNIVTKFDADDIAEELEQI